MQRDPIYIRDIYSAAIEVIGYVDTYDFPTFYRDREKQNACIRLLEVIGEAARRISAQTKNDYPMLSWNEIIAMRNALIHEYPRVDPVVVSETITEDLPELLETLKSLFPDLQN